MSRVAVILNGDAARQRAVAWVKAAPVNSRLEMRPPKRSLPQNSRLWAALTDVATQKEWAGKRRTTGEWKDIFSAALRSANNGLEVVPGLEGGFVLLGMHTSDLSREEMSDLLELISEWGARHGVVFSEPELSIPGQEPVEGGDQAASASVPASQGRAA